MKFKKELNALKEKINKVIERVKRGSSELCRSASCNIFPDFILPDFKEEKKVFLNDFLQVISIMPYFYHSFLFTAAFKKMMLWLWKG
ncbi:MULTISPECIES: hypothetical protein [Bartonella]|uniref:hypothetical protein n=1 Tax=Bartonella TaxID=773 RepID=UPI00236308D8|nr:MULTISPECIES: hypothetical protein [Bartonella]